MRDYLDFDTTPSDEPCAQVGDDYYPDKVMIEMRYLAAQLKKTFGQPPEGARYAIASNAHDFGRYYSLRLVYDDDDPIQTEYAYQVDNDFPQVWDEDTRTGLEASMRALERPHNQKEN